MDGSKPRSVEPAIAAAGDPVVATTARRLLRAGAWFGAAVVVANVLNVVFHVAVARVLVPDDYSVLAVLLGVLLVVGIPTAAIRASVARGVAQAVADGRPDDAGAVLHGAASSLAGGLVVLGLVAAAAGVPLALFLNVQRPLPILAAALAVAFSFVHPLVYGGLQGIERFGTFSVAQVAYAVLKLGLGVGLGALGAGLAGVMIGVALAAGITLAYAAAPLRGLWRCGRHAARSPGIVTRYSAGAAVALTGFATLTTLDVVVARLAFSGETAGEYAAASIGARGLLVVPTVVTTVLFARVASLGDPWRERRHLLAGLGATAAASALAVAVAFVASEPLVEWTFGPQYAEAAGYLGGLAAAMALYALSNVFLFHFLSVGRVRLALGAVAAVPLQAAAYAAFHGSPSALVWVQVATAGALAVCGELALRARSHSTPAGPSAIS